MRPLTLTTTDASGGATTSSVYVVNRYPTSGFAIGFAVKVSGTANYTVQHTFDDIAGGVTPASAVWFDHSSIAAQTTNKDGNYAFPCAAIRLKQNSGNGSCTMIIIQSD